jgi:hypothetical protein
MPRTSPEPADLDTPQFSLRRLGIGTTLPGRSNCAEDPRRPNERSFTSHGLMCRGPIHRFSSSVYPLGMLVAASVAMGGWVSRSLERGIADKTAFIGKLAVVGLIGIAPVLGIASVAGATPSPNGPGQPGTGGGTGSTSCQNFTTTPGGSASAQSPFNPNGNAGQH